MIPFVFLVLVSYALAAPHPQNAIHVPLVRRSIEQDRIAMLPQIMDAVRHKYGFRPANQKRSTTSTSITDELNDSSYSAVVSIGTPAQEFNLILDTGSSDLWVATNQCKTCSGVPLFNPAKSSSFKNGSSALPITYGSGNVNGYVSQDSVGFSGFAVADQTLLSVTSTSANMLIDSLSGIMGLGFQPLSALNTMPFWQFLDDQNALSSPVFSFYFERYVNQAQINTAPGGVFTLGGTNTSLYTGSIEFINMPSGTTPSFWLQQIQTVTIQGKSITVSSNSGLAAIDTGTTLIGAPSDIAKEIWSNVPGSVALGDNYQGMYAFPCGTAVNVSISFGGTNWPISSADMNIGGISGSGIGANMCAGGIFDIGSTFGGSGNAPAWIVGDVFLKNVYSVFQASPPAVGFAALAGGLNTDTSGGSTIPSSSGAVPTGSGTGTGTGSGSPFSLGGAAPGLRAGSSWLFGTLLAGLSLFVL